MIKCNTFFILDHSILTKHVIKNYNDTTVFLLYQFSKDWIKKGDAFHK